MNRITVTVEGGVVQSIDNIPPGIDIEVMDFDTDGADVGQLSYNERGESYVSCVYSADENVPAVEPLENK